MSTLCWPLIHRTGFCFYREGNNSQNLAYLGSEMVAAPYHLFLGSISSRLPAELLHSGTLVAEDSNPVCCRAGSHGYAVCSHPSNSSGWEGRKSPEKETQHLPQPGGRGCRGIIKDHPSSEKKMQVLLLWNLLQPFKKADLPIIPSLVEAQSSTRKRKHVLSGEMGLEATPKRRFTLPTVPGSSLAHPWAAEHCLDPLQ